LQDYPRTDNEKSTIKTIKISKKNSTTTSPMPRAKPAKQIDEEEELANTQPPTSINPYEVLSVPKDATDDQIKKAYRKAALRHHPG